MVRYTRTDRSSKSNGRRFENSELSADVLKGMVGLFGSESLQFQFLDTNWKTAITPFISFNPDTKQLSCRSARVQHMTLGIETLQPGRSVLNYKFWSAPDYISPVLTESSKPYFLYLKASKTFQETGGRNVGEASFFISTDKIKLEDIEGCYTFWVGYLNSENMEGDRSFRTMYGYTEVLPGQITVDKLLSTSGALVIDLLNGVITAKGGATIQGNVTFLSNGSYKDVGDEFNKTNDKIENIQIGGRNLINESKLIQVAKLSGSGADRSITVDMEQGETYTLSYGSTDLIVANAYPQFFIWEYFNWTKVQNLGDVSAKTRTFKFMLPTGKYTFTIYNHNYPQGGTVNELNLEKGSKTTDWTPSPEDVQNGVNDAKNAANSAQIAASTANQSVNNLNTYVDGAFKDGVIDSAEAKAIEKYLNTLEETMSQVEATYNKLYINTYLEGTAKTTLLNAKVNLFGQEIISKNQSIQQLPMVKQLMQKKQM